MEDLNLPILDKIHFPEDLRKLDASKLEELCAELRDYLIHHASKHGGHFAASLGVVELTVALHYIFNTPDDKVVWDVGHQAYVHKILTGRRDLFHTNRKYKGISPFPKMSESKYDAFGVGHSSTSISAALGMSIASKISGVCNKQHIAVIGDGSMTGGLAFEGLNNAGVSKSNILVILNDNNMAIDPNVGALKDYLTDITVSHTYNRFRDDIKSVLKRFKKFGDKAKQLTHHLETTVKSLVSEQSNFFESLQFKYYGPIDGHDINHLTKVLRDLKDIEGPKLLHIITKKGKGFKYAENDPLTWHAPSGVFNKENGEIYKPSSKDKKPPKFQEVFGHTMVDLAKQNEKIVGITPAMPSGSSMNIMMKEFPARSFDVGIAEQHAVTFSAGLATEGYIPFCNIYSSFMQRAYDQIIHDVAIQNIPVIFCMDRAGIAGADGATHHGAYDISYMRCVPNMIVSAPRNEIELRNLMYTATFAKQPFSIRYPRGAGEIADWRNEFEKIEIGKGEILVEGEDLAFISFGAIATEVTKAVYRLKEDNISAAHYDLRFVKPLDEELLHSVFKKFKKIITVEDGCLPGGMGSAVLEFMNDNGYNSQIKRLGIPDTVVHHGTQPELYAECEYDSAHLYKAAKSVLISETVEF